MTAVSMPRSVLPRAVLFDWDNTLVDTWPCLIAALNRTLVHMGQQPWTDAYARMHIAKSLRDSFPEMFGERWEEARDFFYRSFAEIHLEQLVPLNGAKDVLDHLRALGLWVAVVSNKTGTFLRQEAEHLGWTPLFRHLVGAGDAAQDKPALAPVEMALAGSGIQPGPDVWFIGDNRIDMECGHAAGCWPVLINPDPPGGDHFVPYTPGQVFRSCDEFLIFLRNLAVSK